MNVLSLFTGAGGGELAFQHLLTGFRTVGYVEYEPYCQAVIRQRISDGLLDDAPIFSDIKDFIGEGWAESYQGMVDVVTSGFPCQPFSVAGKQAGEDDPRNLWPETMSVIRMVRPRYAFLENVPGLLASGYMPTIFSDLAEAGYNARWTVLGADDVGARHRRKRLWIVANTTSNGCGVGFSERNGGDDTKKIGQCENTSEIGKRLFDKVGPDGQDVANAGESGLPKSTCREIRGIREQKGQPKGCELGRRMSTPGGNWAVEPALDRVAHGVAHRVDRLKVIGNGQVPQVARTAWEILKP